MASSQGSTSGCPAGLWPVIIDSMQTILIVEDEPGIADTLTYVLEQEGFATRWVQLAGEALQVLGSDSIAAVLLDIGLPDASGLETCKQIRARWQVPVLFLTARKEEIDRIIGLEIGADDYISKPFSPREVAARVKAVLRRAQTPVGKAIAPLDKAVAETAQQCGAFALNEVTHTISYHGQLLELTPFEYRILRTLLGQPQRVFSRAQLLDKLSDTPLPSLERSVDSHIRSLRAKLINVHAGHQPVCTRRGFGYYLQPESS